MGLTLRQFPQLHRRATDVLPNSRRHPRELRLAPRSFTLPLQQPLLLFSTSRGKGGPVADRLDACSELVGAVLYWHCYVME